MKKRINATHPIKDIKQVAILNRITKKVQFSDGYTCFVQELRDWEEV